MVRYSRLFLKSVSSFFDFCNHLKCQTRELQKEHLGVTLAYLLPLYTFFNLTNFGNEELMNCPQFKCPKQWPNWDTAEKGLGILVAQGNNYLLCIS